MPSRKDENGVYRDICHSITTAARRQLEDAIIHAYQEYLATAGISAFGGREEPPKVDTQKPHSCSQSPAGILHTRWHVLAIFPIDGPPGKGGSTSGRGIPAGRIETQRWKICPSVGAYPLSRAITPTGRNALRGEILVLLLFIL